MATMSKDPLACSAKRIDFWRPAKISNFMMLKARKQEENLSGDACRIPDEQVNYFTEIANFFLSPCFNIEKERHPPQGTFIGPFLWSLMSNIALLHLRFEASDLLSSFFCDSAL